jgi:glycosyltransferase involved in cell wall biosynthesis
MKILFVTAHFFLPQLYAGLQRSADMLARRLMERGHQISFLCCLSSKGVLGTRARIIRKLLGRPAGDNILGYTVYRSFLPWEHLPWTLNKVKPDVIVVLALQPARMALAARRAKMNIPIVMMLQDVEFSNHGGPFEDLGSVSCVANSHFTARRYRETYGVNPVVINPMIDVSAYMTISAKENVTFVNPDPRKGLDIALAVTSRCPDIPFVFLESWPLTHAERSDLEKLPKKFPNLTIRSSVGDMREIYSRCKILLAPSRWEEAYGRVATEAQCSGIPVIASNRGGLPEAVGEGGILLDPDGPVDNWIAAVRSLWDDGPYYNGLARAALSHAARPALDLNYQTDTWEKVLQDAVGAVPS